MPAKLAGTPSRNLLMRVMAAVVLVPLTLICAYVGGWLWTALVTLAVIGLDIEWLMVVGAASELRVAVAGAVTLALNGLFLSFGRLEAAIFVSMVGLIGIALLSSQRRGWTVTGFVYAAAAQFAAVLVRADSEMGFAALIFVLLIVWATDIGGYFAGRRIGGPKLWPRVSPNKTWAGAVGGFIGSLAVAGGFVASGLGKALPLFALAGVLSIAGQFGDLFESAVKRRFGVKDSSHLIPGHGGLMDRLDGLVAALVLAVIVGLLRYGVDGVGRGLMVW